MQLRQRALTALLAVVVVGSGIASTAAGSGPGPVVPQERAAGFTDQIVFSGLDRPTNIEFAPDGRVFVAEQSGVIKVFDGIAGATPVVFADLRTSVMATGRRGLLGLALAPDFLTDPWVYVGYTHDAPPGGTAPAYGDDCGTRAAEGSCVVTARLSRLLARDDTAGAEQVLITDWCEQYPGRTLGDLRFGRDGALYVTSGDGASPATADYGQLDANPCHDPSREGGALRAQDLRTAGDPAQLGGTLLRLDPTTGRAMEGNSNGNARDGNARRIVAVGLGDPVRATIRPGTDELWVVDNGTHRWAEINRLADPRAPIVNYGWPCFDGPTVNAGFAAAGLPVCEALYAGPAPAAPFYAWKPTDPVAPDGRCRTEAASASALAFYPATATAYPPRYRGALFFADNARGCVWAMRTANGSGPPSPDRLETVAPHASDPVDLELGPGSELYYADRRGGTVRRLRFAEEDRPPAAAIGLDTPSGAIPLTVHFDGTGSRDADVADVDRLRYAWDFTSDGTTDSREATPTYTYTQAGRHTVTLTVSDTLGRTANATVQVLAGLGAPTAAIDTPAGGATWATGETLSFSGHATDAQDGAVDSARLRWRVRLQRCSGPDDCAAQGIADGSGTTGTFVAPDAPYPSYVEIELTATDSEGISHTVVRRVDPRTVAVTVESSTPGLTLAVGGVTGTTPFTVPMVVGSTGPATAPTAQLHGSTGYAFARWSDGGAASHTFTVPATPTVLQARFTATPLTNLARRRTATASTTCNPSETPAKAVNGTIDGGEDDKWCGETAVRDKWLMVNLGAVRDLDFVVVHHAGDGGERPAYNTRDFTIEVSGNATTWTTVATVTANTANLTTVPVNVSTRYVRLHISTSSNLTPPGAARIYELEVLGPA